MNKLLSARSPFWQLLFALNAIWFMLLIGLNPTADIESFESIWLGVAGFVTFLVLLIAYAFSVRTHNLRHPSAKVRVWQSRAPELLEQDEMLESGTRLATKRVYELNAQALPILFIVIMFFITNPVLIALSFAVYVTMYYGIYLRTIWPHLDA